MQKETQNIRVAVNLLTDQVQENQDYYLTQPKVLHQ